MNITTQPFTIIPDKNLLQVNPHIKRLSSNLALKYAGKTPVTEQDLQAMGESLWQALDCHEAYTEACTNAGLRICPVIIESDHAQIQQLPWETLYHPEYGFIGKAPAFALSRHLPNVPQYDSPLTVGPLCVLLFTTITEDQARLDVEQEQAQVQEALLPWISQGKVVLDMPNDGRFSTFQQRLQNKPHLVFLSGHGQFHDRSLKANIKEDYASFAFEAETGAGSNEVEGEILAQAFLGTNVQCVVLSACQSGMTASDKLSAGLMQQLALRGIPHVIGMRESVLDIAGIQFIREFCDQIVQPERVDIALQKSRAVITQPLKDTLASFSSGEAELSYGQWCLPALISCNPAKQLINWDFTPEPPNFKLQTRNLGNITLPDQFIGRRREVRELENDLLIRKRTQLLITGPGGQGKTALAGHLAQMLQKNGWLVIDWSARPENRWSDFQHQVEQQLSPGMTESYNRQLIHQKDEQSKASLLLDLLARKTEGKLLLFFDNLESIQNPETLELDEHCQQSWHKQLINRFTGNKSHFLSWIKAAQQLTNHGVTLILTSRWKIPGWNNHDHWALDKTSYNDYVALARQQPNLQILIQNRDRLRNVHKTLHGNARALTFFAAIIKDLDSQEEKKFLAKLAQAKAESQVDMALAFVIEHRTQDEQMLLNRLQAYASAVPEEGIIKLSLLEPALQNPHALLTKLADASLLEQSYDDVLHTLVYQCSTQVSQWLQDSNITPPDQSVLQAAARYQHYLLKHERPFLSQAIITHHALQLSGEKEAANRLALDRIVGQLSRQGFYQTVLQEWLPNICNSEDHQTRADALNQLGKQHLHLSNYETALKYLQQSLAIQQEIGDKSGEGTTLNNISQIYDARGDYETALKYLQQSLAIQQEIGDKSGEGTTLNNISQIYDARGDYETALKYLQQSLAIRQEIGDKSGEGTTLNNISQIYDARGDYETALKYLQQSLAIRQEIGDKSGEGTTLNNISQIFKARGDYETALKYLQQSLAITQEIGDKSGEGTTLNNISQIYDARGDYETALKYLQQSLAIRQEIGDKSGEGTTLNNMATNAHARGDYETALKYLQQSLAIQQEIGDKSGEGTTLNNISQIFKARGDYETALKYLQQSLAITQEIGDKSGEGTTLNNISQIYDARGDYETALKYLQQSLAIQQEIGDKSGEGTTLNNISQIFKARGDYETALKYLQQSLAITQEIGDKSGEGTTLNNISQIYDARGDYETALKYLQQSLAIRQEIGDKSGLCATLFNIGHIHLQNEEVPQAIQAWVTVYQLAKPMQLSQVLEALENLAEQLGLPDGLNSWETLAQQMNENSQSG